MGKQWKQCQTLFFGAPKSLQIVIAAMKLNNEGDAFKHTFMAAELTLLLGENLSRKICILQEDSNPHNPPAEREMDLHNDEVGIQIGKEVDEETFSIIELFKSKDLDLIAERIMDEMKAGNLITHV